MPWRVRVNAHVSRGLLRIGRSSLMCGGRGPRPHTLCVVACAHARACLCGVRLRAWTERLVALRCIVHESGVSGHRAVVCWGRRARSHRSGIGDTARPWIVESRPCAGRLCEGRGRESLTCPGCRLYGGPVECIFATNAWTIVPIGISIIMSLLLSMSDVTTPHRQRQPNRTSPPRPYAHHTTHRGVHLLTSYVTQEQTARSGTNNAPPLTSRTNVSKAVIHVEEFPPPPLKLVPAKRHRGDSRCTGLQPGHSLRPPRCVSTGPVVVRLAEMANKREREQPGHKLDPVRYERVSKTCNLRGAHHPSASPLAPRAALPDLLTSDSQNTNL